MRPTRDLLLSIFRGLESGTLPALIRFSDGSAYELLILSTAHAEAGDDVVAEVVRVDSPGAVTFEKGACMNFSLADVSSVIIAGQCADPQEVDTQ